MKNKQQERIGSFPFPYKTWGGDPNYIPNDKKAVLCPVCCGKGELELTDWRPSSTTIANFSKICHGCNGSGWVTI
jgi:DnaJ-class molecular chaperone